LSPGASSFVGANLIEVLKDAGNKVIATNRSRVEQPGIFYVHSPELSPKTDPASGDSSRLVAVQSERYREKNMPFFR
jgi:nucleoside-diphosphate-sugar epimerase